MREDFTVVVGTRNNIEWVELYLNTLYATATNKDQKVIITDNSLDEYHNQLLDICKRFPDKVEVIREDGYHIHTLLNAVARAETKYVLFTHIDIVFLHDNWDGILKHQMTTHSAFAAGYVNGLYTRVLKDGAFIKTEFVLGEKELILDSKFDHFYFSTEGRLIDIEHGYLTIEMMKRGLGYLVFCRQIDKYGSIYHYEGNEFIYHCSYSSRIRPDNPNPIPPEEFVNGGIGAMHVTKQPEYLQKWFDEYRPHGVTLETFILNEFHSIGLA